MGDGRGDRQQQARRRGQRRGQAAGGHQGDDPVRQARDLRVGEHDDVAVDLHQLVGRRVCGVQHGAVAVLVLELQQTRGLPVPEPLRALVVLQVLAGLRLDGLHEVQPRHAGNGRGGGIEDGDEQQRPAGGGARVAYLRHREEADDHVRQTRRADHQGGRVGEHVEAGEAHVRRVLLEPQLHHHLVELVEQERVRAHQGAAEAQLRQRVAGELQADEDRGDGVGQDEHAVLGDLRVGDALHAAEHGIEEDNAHAHQQAHVVVHLEEPREGHADALHLPDDVGR